MNDSTVTVVTPQHVLKQQAYILFYSKLQPPTAHVASVKNEFQKQTVDATVTSSDENKSNGIDNRSNKSSSGSNIDDELDFGVSVSSEELISLAAATEKSTSLKKKVNGSNGLNSLIEVDEAHKKRKLSSSSLSREEYDNNNVGGINMRYDTSTTRLRTKFSWALKPLRFVGNARRLCMWSGKNRIKLRDIGTKQEGEEDSVSAKQSFAAWGKAVDSGAKSIESISAKQSFAAWGKVVDSGEAKSIELKRKLSEKEVVSSSSALKHYSDEELNLMDELNSSEEDDDTDSSEDDVEEAGDEDGSEKANARSGYRPDKVIIGEKRQTTIDYSAMVRKFNQSQF
jgi:hypothetical protein